MTLTRRAASVRNSRSAVPGTPTMLAPRSVSSEMSPTELMPLAISASSSTRWLEIRVPGASTLKVFLIRIGMRFATAGAIVAACSTFAPK